MMIDGSRRARRAAAFCLSFVALVGARCREARGDEADKKAILELKAENERQKEKTAALEAELHRLEAAARTPGGAPFHMKSGDTLTLVTPHGEITVYGYLDVSVDGATKGIGGLSTAGMGPVGAVGWMPDLSTNLSYVGVKGFQEIPFVPVSFVYQLETQLDISATAGSANSNSQSDTTVKGALTSRNSFIGLSTRWGALKFGKTDAPYKSSTARMNPFSGMWGDYGVVMGNTGGDNRVEFGTRIDHSIWYESPSVAGLTLAVLFSPGQNRGSDEEQIASGESSCTGGNIPGSGGTVPAGCTDGAYGNVVSASLAWEVRFFYATIAYERHQAVNRTSDLATLDAKGNLVGYDAGDIADEDAVKLGVSWALPSRTTVSAILERMTRYVPARLELENERTRTGSWLALSQEFLERESLHVGWAHAMATPGDPGQHNTAPARGVGTAGANNAADMLTVAFKHRFTKSLTAYADYAVTFNRPYAHYDLGAGGRSVTTDCHDAQLPALGGANGSPHCWAGGLPQGFSVGLGFRF
jgi:predicted porin